MELRFWKWSWPVTNAQYVVQPYNLLNHLYRFVAPVTATSTHSFEWRPGQLVWKSFDDAGTLRATYSYSGTDVPTSRDERVRLNLWLFQGQPPANGNTVEVVVKAFTFTP